MEEVGQRLRAAREATGLTTRQVSAALNFQGNSVSHATIGNYERGISFPRESMLQALGEIYKRSIDWIRGEGSILNNVQYRSLKSVTKHDKTEKLLL